MSDVDSRLNDWCCSTGEFRVAEGDAPWEAENLASRLEVLFLKRCENFIQERIEHGFSESTYVPISGPSIRIVQGEFGAKAYLSQGIDCIDISSGTISFLLWLSLKYAAHEELSRTNTPMKRRKHGHRIVQSIYGSFDVPDSPLLRALAIHVAFAGFLYVLFHELGHLSQGHCRWLASGDFCDFSFDDDIRPVAEATRQHRSMELMADLFATRELSIYAEYKRLMAAASPARFGVFSAVEELCHDGNQMTDLWAYGGMTLTFYLTSSSSMRHPPRETRFLASLLASKIFYPGGRSGMGAEQMASVSAVVNLVAKVAEAAISPMERFAPLTAPLSDERQRERLNVEMLALIADFEVLKPKLRHLSRAPKAFFQFDALESTLE